MSALFRKKGLKALVCVDVFSIQDSLEETAWTSKSIKVVGPVEPQHDSTDQYVGVSHDRALAAALLENQASLAELHRQFIQSGGEGATSLERIVLFPTKSRISID